LRRDWLNVLIKEIAAPRALAFYGRDMLPAVFRSAPSAPARFTATIVAFFRFSPISHVREADVNALQESPCNVHNLR
jgi:hypothetical protein